MVGDGDDDVSGRRDDEETTSDDGGSPGVEADGDGVGRRRREGSAV